MKFPRGIGIAALLIGATVAAHAGALRGKPHFGDGDVGVACDEGGEP